MSSRATRLTGPCPAEPFDWGDTRATPLRSRADTTGGPRVDMAAVEREAFLKGYAQGEKAGGEAAGTHVEAMVRRLAESIEELATLRGEILRRSEQQTVQLALTIAQRLVQREISLDRSVLVGMAHAALDRLADHAAATIRLPPEDYAAVATGLSAHTPHAHVQVVADASVSLGGCVVQSDFGFMDVSHQAQFDELTRVMLDAGAQPRASDDPEHGHGS